MEVNICKPEQTTEPKPAATPKANSLTVISICLNDYVHLSPGEFRHGSKDHYSPEYLLDHGIILVTINYRLGVLGKLS